MRKIKILFTVIIFMLLLTTACSSTSDTMSQPTVAEEKAVSNTGSTSAPGMSSSNALDNSVEFEVSEGEIAQENPESTPEDALIEKSSTENVSTNRKLIQRAELEIETKEFDPFVETIETEVKKAGGYVENSSVMGSSYYSKERLKDATITIRIPVNNYESFINLIGTTGNITRESRTQEDVTLNYVDIKSRNEVLQIEKDRLLEFLKNAQKLSDIISLEERLSEVRYEIERTESQIRTYDNLIDFATISMYISEVERMRPDIAPKTMWQEIKTGFGESLISIQNGFKFAFINFIVCIPYILLLSIPIIIIVFIIVNVIKKRRKIKENNDTSDKQ